MLHMLCTQHVEFSNIQTYECCTLKVMPKCHADYTVTCNVQVSCRFCKTNKLSLYIYVTKKRKYLHEAQLILHKKLIYIVSYKIHRI
jgi:hypothetical protein